MRIAPWLLVLVASVFAVPCNAAEADLDGVFSLELLGGLSFPAPYHLSSPAGSASASGTFSVGPNIGFTAGYGFAERLALRMHFDTFFIHEGSGDTYVDSYGYYRDGFGSLRIIDVGADAVSVFGDPDSVVWRPFFGLGYANESGTNATSVRLGLESLIRLSEFDGAPDLLIQLLFSGYFRGDDDYTPQRILPLIALRVGINFDIAPIYR